MRAIHRLVNSTPDRLSPLFEVMHVKNSRPSLRSPPERLWRALPVQELFTVPLGTPTDRLMHLLSGGSTAIGRSARCSIAAETRQSS